MSRTPEWYRQKALACVTAYQHRYGQNPTKHAVLLILAVALHETACGDLIGPGNWGAVQRRIMTPDERQIVKEGGRPIPRDSFEVLHGDSSPIRGKYQTWFYAFPDGIIYPPADLAGDAAGAWKLLEVLLDQRPSIKAAIDEMSCYALAKLMYGSEGHRYFEGFHIPGRTYALLAGRWTLEDPAHPFDPKLLRMSGEELNVQDYANAIVRGFSEFSANLDEWGFRSPPVAP